MARPLVLVVEDHPELGELLAAALEHEGLEATLATTGAAALAAIEGPRPAAALVDLMLPDMLGTAVLDVLAAAEPPIPAIAVSGVFRGGRYAQEAADHGAARFVEKPFSTQDIVTALRELAGVEAAAPAEDPGDLDAELRATVQPDDPAPYPDAAAVLADPPQPGRREPAGPSDAATRLRRRMGIVEDLIDVPGQAPGDAPHAASGDAALRRDPAAAPRPRPAPRAKGPGRQGDLASTSVPRLLAACHQAGTTGTLRLRRGPVLKVIYLRDGRPTFAASNLAGDRLLTFAVRTGVVRREDAEAALRLAQEEDRRVGELLVELGILDRRSLRRLVIDQVRALIWSTFAWDDGRFEVRTAPDRREPLTLELPLPELLLGGLQRALDLGGLRRRLPDELRLFPQPAPAVPLEEIPLDADGAHLLAAADGTKSVGDLLALSDVPEVTARARLLALVALDVLAPREALGPSARVGFVL